MKKMWALKVQVFLAAFLLFQLELIMAKAILPGFGGSYLVWSVSVMFFQGLLLLGYGYVYLVTRRWGGVRAGRAQVLLILLPVLFFPISLSRIGHPQYQLPAAVEIVWLLLRSVGPAFLMLSTVSIVVQNQLAAADLPERGDPYLLYGTSNLGSFLALLSYPLLFEPFLDLAAQLRIWEGLYLGVAALQVLISLVMFRRLPKERQATAGPSAPLPRRDLLRWFLFSAATAALFLAVTHLITLDLAAIPFLWVLPLSIYLATFALNFMRRPWCPDWLANRFSLALPLGICLFLMSAENVVLPVYIMIPLHLLVLFIACMFIHRLLYRGRPADAQKLSAFYLAIAAGGFFGSALVSWVIPWLVTAPIEYLAGFALAFLALSLGPQARPAPRWSYGLAGLVAPLVVGWPLLVSRQGIDAIGPLGGAMGIGLALVYAGIFKKPRAVLLSLALLMAVAPGLDYINLNGALVSKRRNFYGITRIFDRDGKRLLLHGGTAHGAQYLDPARQNQALLYYHASAPAGELLRSGLFPARAMAIVGLGAGALALYARPGERVDFYELDPDNLAIARRYFTYLAQSPGDLHFIFGDARVNLARTDQGRYDLIVLDAFNSDSIPVHLITTEALTEYRRHLAPGGFILLHVSNRSLNLGPVIAANARALNLVALFKSNRLFPDPDADVSEWMVVTDNPIAVKLLTAGLFWTDLSWSTDTVAVRPWTDQSSNLLSAILAKH